MANQYNPYSPPTPHAAPPVPQQYAGAGPVERRISVMDAFRFMASQPNAAVNIGLGTLLVFIPIIGPLVLAGWLCESMQRLAWQHPQPLPKFSFEDFIHYLKKGLPIFVGQLVYTLGLILPYYAVIGVIMAIGFAGSGPGAVEMGLLTLVSIPWFLATAVLLNAVVTRAELTQDMGRALSPSENLQYAGSTWKPALVNTIIFVFPAFLFMVGGLLLCFIGIYAAQTYVQFASMHLRWQIYNDYLQRGGQSLGIRGLEQLPSELKLAYAPVAPGAG